MIEKGKKDIVKNKWGRPPIWIDKWTDEVVIKELEQMFIVLTNDKEIIYIWELFEWKPYARSSFIQQVSKRIDNPKIYSVYNTIKDSLENRAIKWAMTNKLNAASTIFHLKNNYKWVDKQEIDNTNTNLDVSEELSDTQKQLIAKRYAK